MIILYSTNKQQIILDSNSEWANYKWNINKEGYARRCFNYENKRITKFLHRLVINAKPYEIVDHINRNKLDNRLENLRIANEQINAINRSVALNKLSKYKGVTHKKLVSKIRFQVSLSGKFIGIYDSEIEAAKKYDIEAKKMYGNFAVTNQDLGLL